jgi:hypothetical protein
MSLIAMQHSTGAGASLLFEGLTVVDVYQMGIGFIMGTVSTVILLLVLDAVRDYALRQNQQDEDPS